MTNIDLLMATTIAREILNKIGEPKILTGVHLKYYSEYIKQIEEDEEYIKKEFDNDIDALEELTTEKIHVECVFRWLQENKLILIKEGVNNG